MRLLIILLAVITAISSCTTLSIQTTQYIQNGDRFANENDFDQAKSQYLKYLNSAPQLGIYRNELLEAEIHRKLAYVYSAKAKYDSSIWHLNYALQKDNKFPDNKTNVIIDLTELALVEAYKGNYLDALNDINQFEDTLAISLRKNTDRQAYVNLLLAKARILFTLGEYRESEKILLQCLALINAYPFDVEKAEVKYLLGVLQRDQGRLSESDANITDAITILKKAGLNSATQLHAQGDQLFLLGSLELGITKHIEALKEAENSNIEQLIIRSHTYLGEAYDFIGNRKQADFHFLKAIELQKGLIELGYIEGPLPKKGDLANILSRYQQTGQKSGIAKASISMADYCRSKGKLDSSLYYLNQAYSFYSQNLQINQKSNVQLKMIEVLLDKGSLDSANKILVALETEKMARTYTLPYLQGRYLNLTGKGEEAKPYLRDALNIIEETHAGFSIPSLRSNYLGDKNYVFEEMIDVILQQENLKEADIIEAFNWNERARSRSFLDMIASKNIEPLKPNHKPILDRERSNRLKLIKLNEEIEKNQPSEDLTTEFRKSMTLQKTLLDSITLLDSRYAMLLSAQISDISEIRKAIRPDELLIQFWIGKDHSYLWYASQDTLGMIKLSWKESELEDKINAFRNVIRLKIKKLTSEIAQELFTELLGPIPDLASFTNLIIIPHRSQNFLPFEALQLQNDDFLVQSHAISYAPSSTVFLTKRKTNIDRSSNLMAMALGEETYGSYTPLPGTTNEVKNIARYFDPTKIKIGLESTESILKSADVEYGLIHLATHGVMNKKNPMQTYIALNSDSLNDGRLTVSEIFDLKIRSALTTLSACETALGEVNRGNELVGLSTAFLYSGSKAVIVSLWKVDDMATSLLMTNFYEELSKGLTISDSMAQAQRRLIELPEYSLNPYYWSSFIVVGDGQLPSF